MFSGEIPYFCEQGQKGPLQGIYSAVGDYSQLCRPTMQTYVLYARSGERLADEILMAAVNMLEPPLFLDQEMAALRHELDPLAKPKRGRPSSIAPNRLTLAANLKILDRPDLPDEIRAPLIERLETGEPFNQLTGIRERLRERERDRRILLLEFLYEEIYDGLADAAPDTITVTHLGEIPVPRDARCSRSDLAMKMAKAVLRDQLHTPMPSIARMKNMLSENAAKKRDKIRALNALVGSLPSPGATGGRLRLQQLSPDRHGAVGVAQTKPD